jgi:GT2 family glycosyltransferase
MSRSIAVVVPTRNRSGYLPALFASLEQQDLKPASITVVDSSDDGAVGATREALAAMSIPSMYIHTQTACLPAQRNLGVEAVRRDQDPAYIGFVDDDVRLASDYLRRLAAVLESDTVGAIAGASGVSEWTRPQLRMRRRMLLRLFGLDHSKSEPGRLLPSGINLAVPSDTVGPVLTDWLFGCCMVWRAGVFDRYRFRDDMPGGALYEDVEFSARVGLSHALVVDPQARLVNLLADEGRPDMRLHYYRWMRNRHAVVQSVFGTRSASAAYWWSSFGTALLVGRHAVVGSADYPERFAGLVTGAIDVLRQKPLR